jgi:hypothetical protein
MTDRISEVLDRIEARQQSGVGEPASALDYVQDVYRGRRAADPWRMRAAMAALPFESPKLAITTNLTGQDFAAMLDRAIAASSKAQVVRQIELKAEPESS